MERGRSANPVQLAEQTAQILAAKKAGRTTREIATDMDLSPTTVQKRLKNANRVVEMPPRNSEQAIHNQIECYERRLRGVPVRQIAEDLDMHQSTVRNHIKHEIAARVLPERTEYVQQSLDRIDIAVERLMKQIEADKAVARNAEVLAKLMERQAKMLGYDAPLQTESFVVVDTKPEVLSLIESARAKMQEREATLKATSRRLDVEPYGELS